MIDLGSRKEFFWDDFIIDVNKTTAKRELHHPVVRESVFTFDAPWEGDGCGSMSLVYDDVREVYIMYYTAWRMLSKSGDEHTLNTTKLCCIESRDGINWYRPNLGIVEFDGSKDNNIVMSRYGTMGTGTVGAYFVMRDTNPNPVVPGRFKLLLAYNPGDGDENFGGLYAFTSDDGHHFKMSNLITDKGAFDTVNTVCWHEPSKRYICYIRHHHLPGGTPGNYVTCDWFQQDKVRDIRVLWSEDFLNWSDPEFLDYSDDEDLALYTNCVTPYINGEHILVGFPTRYVDRPEWVKSYERLCAYEKRMEVSKLEERFGRAITDCIFMCSRDSKKWLRYREAFIAPSPERPSGWLYGEAYPSVGMIKTKSVIEGADDELSFYVKDGSWMCVGATLPRQTIRQDGFLGMRAGIEPKKVVTKEFTFTGDTLRINFETSAYGNVYVKLIADNGEVLTSCEQFGNKIDRIVDFDGNVADFAGRPVHLEFELCDAEVYAFQFTSENAD